MICEKWDPVCASRPFGSDKIMLKSRRDPLSAAIGIKHDILRQQRLQWFTNVSVSVHSSAARSRAV